MTDHADMRAGDADRDQTTEVLREAYAEGRLTDAEFHSRLDAAHAAVTFGDLAKLTADLPDAPLASVAATAGVAAGVPIAAPDARPAAGQRESLSDEAKSGNWKKAWAAWLGVGILMIVIWLATWMTSGGPVPYFWPIWVIGPWGAAMLIGALVDRAGNDD